MSGLGVSPSESKKICFCPELQGCTSFNNHTETDPLKSHRLYFKKEAWLQSHRLRPVRPACLINMPTFDLTQRVTSQNWQKSAGTGCKKVTRFCHWVSFSCLCSVSVESHAVLISWPLGPVTALGLNAIHCTVILHTFERNVMPPQLHINTLCVYLVAKS